MSSKGTQDFDLICLGCGPAGEKAATQAAYFGHRVAVIELCAKPGGAMVNTGTLPSKTLRETALLCSAFNRRPLPGIDFNLEQNLSVAKFMARRHLLEMQEHDRIENSFDRQNITVLHGRGTLIDVNTVAVNNESGETKQIRGKHILIATGSSPLRPSHVPFHLPGVVDADGVLEMQGLPKSMIVVGGGVIGCEYASIFAEINVQVTLVHTGECILPFLDVELREGLVSAMKERGIEFRPNANVTQITPCDDRVCVKFEDGSTSKAESLLWAAGRSSNTQNLGLEQVGVTMGQRGLIVVNEHYQTNVPSIYAAGDVIGFPALAATSMEQGRIAACHMFGIEFKKRLTSDMPVGLYTIPAVSYVGLMEADALKAKREVVIGRTSYCSNARGRMLGDEQGLVKWVFDRHTRQLLGAGIVGEDATELIHIAQAVIASGAGVEYFINTCFNYPSLGELYKYAAYSALQAMKAEARPLAA